MKPTMLLAVLALAACGVATSDQARGPAISGRARALDGDTISLDFRFSGVDAVESRQQCQRGNSCYPCGKMAQNATARMLKGHTATVTMTGASSYGRPVAIVTVDGIDVGEQLIAQGWAVPAVEYLNHDPVRAARYLAAFAEAQRHRFGIHAGTWVPPSAWRRGKRLACEPRGRSTAARDVQ